MKKIILGLVALALLASGCIMSDAEVNKRDEANAETAAKISKMCKEAGLNVGMSINGDYYCKP